jgi:hypothetical protein
MEQKIDEQANSFSKKFNTIGEEEEKEKIEQLDGKRSIVQSLLL